MILSGRERERIITRIRKRKTQTSRDRENVSETKETRERKICALTRTRCAPGTTLAEAVVGHQSSLFSLLNFFVRSKKILFLSRFARIDFASPQLQKRENKSALSLSLSLHSKKSRTNDLFAREFGARTREMCSRLLSQRVTCCSCCW